MNKCTALSTVVFYCYIYAKVFHIENLGFISLWSSVHVYGDENAV